jgi:Ca-activated chloride channel family protein
VARWLAATLYLCLLAAPVAAEGQKSDEPAARTARSGQPDFRTSVDLVSLTVTVTDRERRFVQGLRSDDFVVLEDGVPQPVTFFGVETVPLDLALLVDSSSSMRDELEIVRDAAAGLLRMLRAGDRASLVEFRQGVRVAEALTGDLGKVAAALRGIRPGGATSLYNALYVTLKEFQKRAVVDGDVRRRAIVVLSDGEDTTSMLSFEDVLEQAKRSGVVIYTISLRASAGLPPEILGNQRSTMEADYGMRALAYDTGGRAFFPKASRELKAIYADVGQELAAQYALGYVPSNPMRDGTWRHVAVRVSRRPDVRPRTRSGYYAPSERPLARRGW